MNQYLNFSLEGKVALVTGASYGIGFAIASAFAEQGAKICFNDINQELVDKGMAAYAEKGISLPQAVMDNIIAHNKAPHTIFLLRPVIVRSFSSFLSIASLIAFLFQYNIDSGNYKSNYAYHEEKYGLLQDWCAPVII